MKATGQLKRGRRMENIRKIVSGMDEESLEQIKKVYDLIIEVTPKS